MIVFPFETRKKEVNKSIMLPVLVNFCWETDTFLFNNGLGQVKWLRYVFVKHFSKGSLQYPVIFSFSDTLFHLIHFRINVSCKFVELPEKIGLTQNWEHLWLNPGFHFLSSIPPKFYLVLVAINKSMFQCTYLMHCPLNICILRTIELDDICLHVWLSVSFYGFLIHFKSWYTELNLGIEKLKDHLFNCVHYYWRFSYFMSFLMIFPRFSHKFNS